MRYNFDGRRKSADRRRAQSSKEIMQGLGVLKQQEIVRPSPFQKLLPMLAEVWIFAVILVFLAIRILGSNTVKHLFGSLGR